MLLIIRKTQIKTKTRYHLIPVQMSIIKNKTKQKQRTASVGNKVEQLEQLCTVDENVKWRGHCGEQYGGPSES